MIYFASFSNLRWKKGMYFQFCKLGLSSPQVLESPSKETLLVWYKYSIH